MYNCFFGMPYRHNFPYQSSFNRKPQTVQQQDCDQQQPVQISRKYHCNYASANESLLKCSASGGLVLPENTDKNATYTVSAINLDTSAYRNFSIKFNFSCNIFTDNARMHLKFQLLKQEKHQSGSFPVSSSFIYSRNANSSETNTFSLTACDCDSISCKCCTYHVEVKVMGFNTVGTIMITNPILFAYIIESNNEIV